MLNTSFASKSVYEIKTYNLRWIFPKNSKSIFSRKWINVIHLFIPTVDVEGNFNIQYHVRLKIPRKLKIEGNFLRMVNDSY